MEQTTVTRTINAPIQAVFETVAHIENYTQAVPGILKVEFLSDTHVGKGTRFRETRLMGKKEAVADLEVTEYVQNEHVRLVSDTGGTLWDTVFSVKPVSDGAVELSMVMDATAHSMAAKLMNPMIQGFIKKAIERDMDAVKAHCERGAPTGS